MDLAARRAQAIRRTYGLVGSPTDDDLARVCHEEGLGVVEAPELVGRVKEVVIGDALCLAVDLDRRERRWLTAHGLGHWLLHEPGGYFYMRDHQLVRDQQEWLAEVFAGWLLCCDGPVLPMGRLVSEGVAGLAEWAGVPYHAAHRWAGLVLPRGPALV